MTSVPAEKPKKIAIVVHQEHSRPGRVGALLEKQVVAIAIVAIVLQERDLLGPEAVDDPPDHRRLPRPRATPDTNYKRRRHG